MGDSPSPERWRRWSAPDRQRRHVLYSEAVTGAARLVAVERLIEAVEAVAADAEAADPISLRAARLRRAVLDYREATRG